MSYALRNTIVLLVALMLLAGGGFSYIYFFQLSEVERLESELQSLEEEYESVSAVAAVFPLAQSRVQRAENFIESFDRSLFKGNNPDAVYRNLVQLNQFSPYINFNFIFTDSTQQEAYGSVRSNISGSGPYRAVYNFVNRIENSMAVQRINEFQMTPINEPGEYGNVNFSFVLQSIYDRTDFFDISEENFQIAMNPPNLFHNPFFPLLRDVEPNVDELVNVGDSQLIGLSNNRIFLRNQEGQLVQLAVGDQVWLGRLEEIDTRQRLARFRLNRGGLIEVVTLEVQ
ncbi:MAG: hypothetical protein WDZ29_03545 [Balneolaceae bacterium]